MSVLGIRPSSQSAVNATAQKEIQFENFSLFEFKEDTPAQKLFASQSIKYKNRLTLQDMNLTDQNGHILLANEAVYINDEIYMNKDISVIHDNGLTFSTEILNYNLKNKELETFAPFYLDFNGSTIKGSNLKYNLKGKDLYANEIKASIIFISPDETSEE